MRLAIAALLTLIPAQGLADAKEQRPPPPPTQVAPAPPIQPEPRAPAVQAGLYRTTAFVTRFDGNGGWVTSVEAGAAAAYKGRYIVERGVIVFSTTPPYCPDERVSYRLVPDQKGFKIQFLADSCKRAPHPPDWVFVRADR